MSVDLDAVRVLEEQLRAEHRKVSDVVPLGDANSVLALADTLRDLRAEVERLRKACNSARQRLLVASGFVDQKEVREAIGHSISLCDEAL